MHILYIYIYIYICRHVYYTYHYVLCSSLERDVDNSIVFNVCMYVCMYVCIYVYVYMYMCVYIYIYIYDMHTHTEAYTYTRMLYVFSVILSIYILSIKFTCLLYSSIQILLLEYININYTRACCTSSVRMDGQTDGRSRRWLCNSIVTDSIYSI